jgi:hypothetical protein
VTVVGGVVERVDETGVPVGLDSVVHAVVMGADRDDEAREAELNRREAALAARVELAEAILAAAAERDDDAEHRDVAASTRDREADLVAFVAKDGDSYGDNASARRNAAMDRMHAKDDRSSAAEDREALTEDAAPDGSPEQD